MHFRWIILSMAIGSGALQAQLPKSSDIKAVVERALKKWQVPGVAVAVVHRNQVVYLQGHGKRHIDDNASVTPDTLFPMASCTKAFTTTAMAMQVDQGKLKWDDRVQKHLPWFRLSDPHANAQVTLRDLITHRTGLRSHDLLWYRSPWSQRETIERAGKLKLTSPIRTKFYYQSTMFTAAGMAMASAAKQPWESVVRDRIFKPLGMKGSRCTTVEIKKIKDRATGHRLNARNQAMPEKEWYDQKIPDPAGSVSSTARDLVPWLQLHLSHGMYQKQQLVSEKNLQETHTPQMVIPLTGHSQRLHPDSQLMSYGMAWVIQDYRGKKLVSHAGVIDGFKTHLTLVPDANVGIAILSNLHQTRMNLALSYTLVDMLTGLKPKRNWDNYLQKQMAAKQAKEQEELRQRLAKRKIGTKPTKHLAAYARTYEHPAYGKCKVVLQRGRLQWRWGSFILPLEHFHNDTWVLTHPAFGHIEIAFHLDPRGKVIHCKVDMPLGVTFIAR